MIPGLYYPIPVQEPKFGLTFIGSTFSTANSSTYSFASQNIGDPPLVGDNRYVIVIAQTGGPITNAPTCTVNSSTATAVNQVITASQASSSIFRFLYNGTSTSVTITVGMSSAAFRCSIDVFRMVGADITVAANTASDVTVSSTALSASITIPTGGGGVAGVIGEGSAGPRTWTWSGMTEVSDRTVEANFSASCAMTTVGGTAATTALASAALTGSANVMSLAAWTPRKTGN